MVVIFKEFSMIVIKRALLLGLLGCFGPADTLSAGCQPGCSPRQYHTRWTWSADHAYKYCLYVYKETANGQYKTQYCVESPKYPGCYFYYNSNSGKYWGLCFEGQPKEKMFIDISSTGVPAPDRIDTLKKDAGPMPAIPGSTDGVAMIPPGTLR